MTAPMVRILGLLGAALLLASCSGPFFSKVEVKASPTVYAALGNAKANISDYVSVGKIREILKGSKDLEVYDYQDPADTTQKFLIHFPLQSVPLDFGEYMKNLKLDDSLSQTLSPGTFTIPTINQTKNSTGTFDLNTTLRNQVNTGFTPVQQDFVETGSPTSLGATLPDVTISVSQFTTATFTSGSLNLTLSMTGASAAPGFVLTTTIQLVDSNNNVLTSSPSLVDVVAGGVVSLPLTGVTLPGTFKVRFTANTKGGTFNQTDKVRVLPALVGVSVSGATGINLNTSVTTSASIPVDAGGKMVEATIATGNITITLAALPTGWTGFQRTTAVDLIQDGITLVSKSLTDSGAASGSLVLVLDGKKLSNSAVTVSVSSSITATNASFSGLSGSGTVTMAVDSTVSIEKFTSLTAKPGADFSPPQVINQTVSDQMLEWVQEITFNEVGVQFKITNGLPAGNPMSIVMSSNELGITGQTPVALPADGLVKTATFTNKTAGFVLKPKLITNKAGDTKPDLDFTVTLVPDSWDNTAKTMVLYNIVPGASLAVTGTISFISDWTTALVNPPKGGAGFTDKFPNDGTTTDLSTLATYFKSGINFASVPAYFYLSGIKDQVMSSQVVAHYGTATNEALVGTTTGTEDITMTETGPNFAAYTNGIIASDWTTVSTPQKTFSLANLLNARPNNLWFDYKFNVASTINVVRNAAVSQKIQADLVVILPLSLLATSGAPLGIDNPLPADDLFGRKAGGDNSNINNLLDKLVSMKMSLNLTNKTGLGLTAKLVKGGTSFSKDLTIPVGGGTVDLTLDATDIQTIKNTIPFDLAMTVAMPVTSSDTTYNLTRGGSINANITVNAVTDIDQTFNLRGTN